jgi:hypothetical protein
MVSGTSFMSLYLARVFTGMDMPKPLPDWRWPPFRTSRKN